MNETVIVILDRRGYLHIIEDGDAAVCGLVGERQERPIDWAGIWCTACLQTCGFQVAS